jgi:hypothetical protein
MRTIRGPSLPIGSSWSRDDHEDGGPTIQMPAADGPPHPSITAVIEYTSLRPTGSLMRRHLAEHDRYLLDGVAFRLVPKCHCLARSFDSYAICPSLPCAEWKTPGVM